MIWSLADLVGGMKIWLAGGGGAAAGAARSEAVAVGPGSGRWLGRVQLDTNT